jgi:hypothetical protein
VDFREKATVARASSTFLWTASCSVMGTRCRAPLDAA